MSSKPTPRSHRSSDGSVIRGNVIVNRSQTRSRTTSVCTTAVPAKKVPAKKVPVCPLKEDPCPPPPLCPPTPCPPTPCPPTPCPPTPCPPTPCPPKEDPCPPTPCPPPPCPPKEDPCPPPPCPPPPCPPKEDPCKKKQRCWVPCSDNMIWWARGLIAVFGIFVLAVVGGLGSKYEASSFVPLNWYFMKNVTVAFVLYALAIIALISVVFIWPMTGSVSVMTAFVMILTFFAGIAAIYGPLMETPKTNSGWILGFIVLALILLLLMLASVFRQKCVSSSVKYSAAALLAIPVIVDIIFIINYGHALYIENQSP